MYIPGFVKLSRLPMLPLKRLTILSLPLVLIAVCALLQRRDDLILHQQSSYAGVRPQATTVSTAPPLPSRDLGTAINKVSYLSGPIFGLPPLAVLWLPTLFPLVFRWDYRAITSQLLWLVATFGFLIQMSTTAPLISDYPGHSWIANPDQAARLDVISFVAMALSSGILITDLVTSRRPDRGTFCKTCGYDLTENASGICSECGSPTHLGNRLD